MYTEPSLTYQPELYMTNVNVHESDMDACSKFGVPGHRNCRD